MDPARISCPHFTEAADKTKGNFGRTLMTGFYSKLVPNVRKLGLLDANHGYLRKAWGEAGLLEYEFAGGHRPATTRNTTRWRRIARGRSGHMIFLDRSGGHRCQNPRLGFSRTRIVLHWPAEAHQSRPGRRRQRQLPLPRGTPARRRPWSPPASPRRGLRPPPERVAQVASVASTARPTAPPTCCAVAWTPEAQACVLARHLMDRGDTEAGEVDPRSECHDDDAGQRVAPIRAVDRDPRKEQHAGAEEECSGEEQRLQSHPRGQLAGQTDSKADHHPKGQVGATPVRIAE